jgi:hypothetical protein
MASIFMIVFGIFTGIAAFCRETRLRPALSYGKGPGVPVSLAGRVVLFAIALVLEVDGIRGLFQ